jgi:hypothetical protein
MHLGLQPEIVTISRNMCSLNHTIVLPLEKRIRAVTYENVPKIAIFLDYLELAIG